MHTTGLAVIVIDRQAYGSPETGGWMELIEKAPAKINLSLDALYRHDDGEHEWQMVMTSVDLADYVMISPHRSIQYESAHLDGYWRDAAAPTLLCRPDCADSY